MIPVQPGDHVSYRPPNYGIAEQGILIELDNYHRRALVEWFDRTRTWVEVQYLKALR